MSMKHVAIYTTPSCHFCQMAKAFFKEHNVQYEEYNVAEDQARRTEMIQMTGQLGVPVIAIDDMLMVGFSQAKVAEMLGISA